MSFFTNVTKEGSQAAFGKFGFEGPPGSGKSTTAALLAVGISKTFHDGAPVIWADSENGANFIRPIFLAEKVDLLVKSTKSLSVLKDSVAEGKKEGACILVPDSMTKFWTTLVANYMKENNIKSYRQMLSHWPAVKDPWREWSDLFINAPLHMIACGRGGFEYDQVDVIDSEGNVNTETVKGDFKMKGEGEFGHEPDVNLHFQAMTDPNAPQNVKQKDGKKGKVKIVAPRKIHVATVQKGRVWQLNGRAFQWADRDTYKAGEFKSVLDCFMPYLEALNIGGKHSTVTAEYQFPKSETNGGYVKKVKILESWKTTMDQLFAGRDVLTKQRRMFVGEVITTGIRSAKEFSAQPVEALDFQYMILRKFEERLKQEGMPDGDPKNLQGLLDLARLEAEEDWNCLHPPNTSQNETAEPDPLEVF